MKIPDGTNLWAMQDSLNDLRRTLRRLNVLDPHALDDGMTLVKFLRRVLDEEEFWDHQYNNFDQ